MLYAGEPIIARLGHQESCVVARTVAACTVRVLQVSV